MVWSRQNFLPLEIWAQFTDTISVLDPLKMSLGMGFLMFISGELEVSFTRKELQCRKRLSS